MLEEVNDSDIRMEPLRYLVSTPPAGMEQNQPHADSFDGLICAAGAPAPCERGYSPQSSTQLVGKMDPTAPGWTSRYVRTNFVCRSAETESIYT